MSYLRTTSGVAVMDRVNREDVYGTFGMAEREKGVNCGVVR